VMFRLALIVFLFPFNLSYSLEQRGIITRTMIIALALAALGALLVLAAIISFL